MFALPTEPTPSIIVLVLPAALASSTSVRSATSETKPSDTITITLGPALGLASYGQLSKLSTNGALSASLHQLIQATSSPSLSTRSLLPSNVPARTSARVLPQLPR